jgi:hypothetical protein
MRASPSTVAYIANSRAMNAWYAAKSVSEKSKRLAYITSSTSRLRVSTSAGVISFHRPTAVHDEIGLDNGVGEVRRLFDEFEQLGVMMLDGDHALALALPAVSGR